VSRAQSGPLTLTFGISQLPTRGVGQRWEAQVDSGRPGEAPAYAGTDSSSPERPDCRRLSLFRQVTMSCHRCDDAAKAIIVTVMRSTLIQPIISRSKCSVNGSLHPLADTRTKEDKMNTAISNEFHSATVHRRTHSSRVAGKPVADGLLHEIYDLAKWDPRAHNHCPWRIVFVKSNSAKEKLIPRR